MSRHQQSKPSLAKWSIAEESGRPGTCRSNVGCDAIDEPCTNKTVPLLAAGSPANFSNRNSCASPALLVQCSSALMADIVIALFALLVGRFTFHRIALLRRTTIRRSNFIFQTVLAQLIN